MVCEHIEKIHSLIHSFHLCIKCLLNTCFVPDAQIKWILWDRFFYNDLAFRNIKLIHNCNLIVYFKKYYMNTYMKQQR